MPFKRLRPKCLRLWCVPRMHAKAQFVLLVPHASSPHQCREGMLVTLWHIGTHPSTCAAKWIIIWFKTANYWGGVGVSEWEKLHAVLFFDHLCMISQPGPICKTNCFIPTTLGVPEVLTKQFIKGSNIGSNNLHSSLDFGDGLFGKKEWVQHSCKRQMDKDGNVIGLWWGRDWLKKIRNQEFLATTARPNFLPHHQFIFPT